MRYRDRYILLSQAKDIVMVAGFASLILWSLPASTQTARQDSIASRTKPHTEPIGMVVGPYDSFLLFPQFILETEFTDNLFSARDDKSSDIAFVLKPSFLVKSDWVNHSLTISGNATHKKLVENISEDTLSYGITVNGQFSMLEQGNLNASLSFKQDQQGRGEVDDEDEQERTEFTTATLKLGGLYNEDAILVKLDVKIDRIDYEDAGTTNNDDRDRLLVKSTLRTGYEWVPGSTAFIEASYNIRHFDTSVDDDGFKRSSRGFEILLGNTLDVSAVTFVELGVGYIKQDFEAQLPSAQKLGPTKGFSFSGDLVWNSSDLLTFSGTMRRSINDTTIAGASSAFTSSFGLKADYGFLEELLLTAEVNLNVETFDGINRTDKLVKFNLGGNYFIGSNFIVNAKYTYEERIADDDTDSYTSNGFIFSLTARF